MYLFIDTISDPNYLALFDKERTIIDTQTWLWKHHEFDTLVEEIDNLLTKNNLPYGNLSGIVVIVWPGGFTGTRITTLVANTISYSFHVPLFPLTVGEFFAMQHAPFPWITPVTKKEVLLWTGKEPNDFTIAQISDLPEGAYSGISSIDFSGPNHTMHKVRDYAQVIAEIPLLQPSNRIRPIYARDPNITLKKIPHAQ